MAAAVELFPVFARAHVLRTWGGIVDVTPDASPIVGLTPWTTSTSTAAGARAVSRPPRASAGCTRTPSPTASPTRSTRRSRSTVSSPAPRRRARRCRRGPLSRSRTHAAHHCPWCGPRDEAEFHYGGQAHVAYPADPAALTTRSGPLPLLPRQPQGPFAERWSHSAGCRRWFNAVRDTATNELLAVYRAGKTRGLVEDHAGPQPLRRGPTVRARGRPRARHRSTFTFDGNAYQGPRRHPGLALLATASPAGPASIRPPPRHLLRRRGGPNASSRSRNPSPSRCCPPRPSSSTTASSPPASPAGPPRHRTGPRPLRRRTHPLRPAGRRRGPGRSSPPRPRRRSGARVILADDQSEPGGALARPTPRGLGRRRSPPRSSPPPQRSAPASHHRLRPLRRQPPARRRAPHQPLRRRRPRERSRERVWRIRARRVVLATGAHERSLGLRGQRPPRRDAGPSARTYVNRHAVLPGAARCVFTTNDSAYAQPGPRRGRAAVRRSSTPARPGVGRAGEGGRRSRSGAPDRSAAGRRPARRADAAAGTGSSPPTCCWSAAAGTRWRTCSARRAGSCATTTTLGSFVPAGRCAQSVVGAVQRRPRPDGLAGAGRGRAAAVRRGPPAHDLGRSGRAAAADDRSALQAYPSRVRPATHAPFRRPPTRRHRRRPGPRDRRRYALGRARQALHHDGTAHDQGKTSGVLAAGSSPNHSGSGRRAGHHDLSARRTPGLLRRARRPRPGALCDRSARLPVHDWQWRTAPCSRTSGSGSGPGTTPAGEDMDAAVARECRGVAPAWG